MRTQNGPAVRLGDVERAPVVSAIGDVCRTEALGRPDCDQRIAQPIADPNQIRSTRLGETTENAVEALISTNLTLQQRRVLLRAV